MTCPYLSYRQSDEEHSFETERPYCGVVDSFVSPMRADICNDRHSFDHASDCETFPTDEVADREEAVPAEPSE